jgi:hypothetical protein
MAEPKTRMTEASVTKFIETIEDEQKRDDCFAIIKMMTNSSEAEPKMWGTAIVGFGKHELRYATGKTLDWPVIAFSPRKQNIVLYLHPEFLSKTPLLKKLGKHKTGKGCLYINSLSDIDMTTFRQLCDASVQQTLSA